MKFIIFDFEVFKYDVLLGAYDVNNKKYFQSWNKEEIKKFYNENLDAIWVGWNNDHYDNHILEAIINNKNVYEISDKIIKNDIKLKSKLNFYSYDLMSLSRSPVSLKLTELMMGKNIHISEVDFNINRPLTNEEKKLVECYNRDDLDQTKEMFKIYFDKFRLRINIIKNFNLSLKDSLSVTGTKLAAQVLHAKNDITLKDKIIKPKLYDNLIIKNQDMINFFLNEEYKKGKKEINVAGITMTASSGGAHAGTKKFNCKKFLYFDVSGYYNLIMLNYDLLPRTIPEEGKKLYEYMYHQQLTLKKKDPVLRVVYKTILLSVFGAMGNEYCDFYDPSKLDLVCLTGQLFIVDLLEKLEDYITTIQINTDGIMVLPNNEQDINKIISIVEEWEKRTGFTIKKEIKYNLFQRDVNCYIYSEDENNEKLVVKGEAVKNYELGVDTYANGTIFDSKEPPIIAKSIVNYLIYNKNPEETIEENKNNLLMYQYPCKKGTFDYMELETKDLETNEIKTERIPNIVRAFSSNSKRYLSMIYKHKNVNEKHSKTKLANLPDNIFVYNDEILSDEAVKKLQEKIDYNYYVKRAYERIKEFLPEKKEFEQLQFDL